MPPDTAYAGHGLCHLGDDASIRELMARDASAYKRMRESWGDALHITFIGVARTERLALQAAQTLDTSEFKHPFIVGIIAPTDEGEEFIPLRGGGIIPPEFMR